MSQPSEPFDSGLSNATGQQQRLTQAELEDLFGTTPSNQPAYPSNQSPALSDLDFALGNTSLLPIDPVNTLEVSLPDFTNYDLGRPSLTYPTPAPNSPHPYPLEQQQREFARHPNAAAYPSNQRPATLRSYTNTACLHLQQTPQTRRRSLSHGDVDRIAASNSIPNPTFVRLQAPRARSLTPEEKRRGAPYPQHVRSASQGPRPRGRPMKPAHSPHILHDSPLAMSLLPTAIGTPLDEMSEEDEGYQSGLRKRGVKGPSARHASPGRPLIRHMLSEDQLARSKMIIEIGAMKAWNRHAPIDPQLELQTPASRRACMLEKLSDIERYFESESGSGDNTAALRGCAIVRQAIQERRDIGGWVEAGRETEQDCLDAPSRVFCELDHDMYGGDRGDNELMALLMEETEGSKCG